MAGDDKKLETALNKHQRLLKAGELSRPDEVGKVAIVFSTYEEASGCGDIEAFEEEAWVIDNKLKDKGRQTQIVECVNRDTLFNVVVNRAVSSLVIIGNGSFSSFWLPPTKPDSYQDDLVYDAELDDWRFERHDLSLSYVNERDVVDWYDLALAEDMDHLKTGYFAHRTCGGRSRDMNLPLGTFLMQHATRITASTHVFVEQTSPDESQFIQIFPTDLTNFESHEELKAFVKTNFAKTDNYSYKTTCKI